MFRQKNDALLPRLLGGTAAIALMATASGAWASVAPAKSTVDIPAGPLDTALNTVGLETNSEVLFAKTLVSGHTVKRLKGVYGPADALAALLSGTHLHAQQTGENVFVIEAMAAQQTPPRQPAQEIRVAATTQTPSLETVVVTAQHRSEDIQTVPISITALSQQQLTDRQIAGGPDLLKSVPNMDFTKTNFSGYNIELRGIGTQAISVTTDPAVAVAFNDTPFIRNHFFEQEFYDLADAEVLLGPQGTLYGRNATAGVVNLKSALPADQYEAMFSADIGNYSNRRYEGMLNIPIVGDKLDIRFAGEWTKRDGYSIDTTYGTPIDGRDLWSGRMTIGWKPTSDLQTYFVWEHFSEDDDRLRSGKQLCKTSSPPASIDGVPVPSPTLDFYEGNAIEANFFSQGCEATSLYSRSAFQVPDGYSLPYDIALATASLANPYVDPYAETTQSTNLRQIQSQILPTYRARNDTLEFNATYDVTPALTLTSQTGYNQDFLWSSEDYNRFDTSRGIFQTYSNQPLDPGYFFPDPTVGPIQTQPGFSPAIFCDPQLGCSDRIVAQDLDVEHAWQLSQEFRLASNFSGPLNFSLGANYLHYETTENYYVFVNALSAFAASAGDHNGTYTTRNNSDCLQTVFDLGGWQNPNPVIGGGEPTQTCIYIDTNPVGSLNNKGHNYFLNQNPYTLNSYAGFGELYYNIAPDVKFTTGLRYTVDQKHFTDIPSEVIAQQVGYPVTGIVNQQWDRLTGRAVLNWTPTLDFTEQSMFYASYAHGYKAGGANPPGAVFVQVSGLPGQVGTVDHPLTFKPEYIEAFELGTKNTLLDSSLTLNGDIFYYNYTGYQISEIVDRTAINNNYNAHVEGAEVTANWEPVPGLKFNFAGGWEDTAAAGGDKGIDLMDRTAGMPGWTVIKPYPTQASNCILPNYVLAALLTVQGEGYNNVAGFACETAYTLHLDPVTGLPYTQPTPAFGNNLFGGSGAAETWAIPAGYPGFNPLNPAINNGEGFLKNLSGNQLPNAPPFTVSLGGEYSMPITEDWVGTLRADFYWQADSWARIFNANPYDRIHGYDTLNLSLILNSANGWSVMAYVKNVFDTTAITGDFLNSDDSGLTTNVFLTDPRLFGVRVTKQLDEADGFWGKEWSGADIISDFFSDTDGGKPPLWIELGGQAEHVQGQGAVFSPGFLANNPQSPVLWKGTSPTEAQQPPLFSFGEEAKISFEPSDTDWVFSAAVRIGRAGNHKEIDHQTGGIFYFNYESGKPLATQEPNGLEKFADTISTRSETHAVLDFMAGKDIGLGMFGLDGSSVVSGGVRIAQFDSAASMEMRARPDLEFKYFPSADASFHAKIPHFHTYHATAHTSRKFHGVGPSVSWSGSAAFAGNPQDGEATFDWGANAALLFGRQRSGVSHFASGHYHSPVGGYALLYSQSGGHSTNRRVTVPNLGGFAGLSWRYNNAKVSFGYRADLFFGAIDGGIDKRHSETLNMGGPFATISLGLGG